MNIKSLFDELRVRYWEHGDHQHVSNGWIGTDCPYCAPRSGKVRMGWNLEKGFCTCWICGPHKRVETLAWLADIPERTAWKLFGGIDFERLREQKFQGKLEIPKGVGKLKRPHIEYLEGRGFDVKALVKLWRIEGIGIASKLQWRIYIPIYWRGEVVSWTTRAITDEARLKYINAKPEQEKMHCKDLLYGEDYTGHAVAIHEGPTDVWAVGPGAVCTLGTAFTTAQVEKLAKYPKRIVCFDSEPAAQKRARSLCDQLSPFDGETLNVTLDAKDPGSASGRELSRLRRMMR